MSGVDWPNTILGRAKSALSKAEVVLKPEDHETLQAKVAAALREIESARVTNRKWLAGAAPTAKIYPAPASSLLEIDDLLSIVTVTTSSSMEPLVSNQDYGLVQNGERTAYRLIERRDNGLAIRWVNGQYVTVTGLWAVAPEPFDDVVDAWVMLTTRMFRRHRTSYGGESGFLDIGTSNVPMADADILLPLCRYYLPAPQQVLAVGVA
jgi:hypothetical protein